MIQVRNRPSRVAIFATGILATIFLTSRAFATDLRMGIIGTDTSHAVEFTKILNDALNPDHIPGARVVAVFKSSSPDIPNSRDRVEGFSAELKDKWHIQFVSAIRDLCPLVDGILLESVDGRTHLDQFRQAAACGKPVFIDKPLASTLSDALEIGRIAKASKVPWFSASSFRFGPAQAMRSPDVTGAYVWGPGPLETHHQLDLSWYAVHAIEMLFTIMGPDVMQVTRTYDANPDVVTGVWKDGRIGTVRAIRPYSTIGAVVFHQKKPPSVYADVDNEYFPLVREIVKFVQTGVAPVSNDETLKMFEFIDAAQQSREHGGIPVNILK
jgi:hypothetical protein